MSAKEPCRSMMNNRDDDDDDETTEVLIIGNGPSAIMMSFLLSGYWPYYAPENTGPHPDAGIHDRLLYHCATEPPAGAIGRQSKPKLRSLMETDLRPLSYGLIGGSKNPVSLLFDQLQHPNADRGERLPSKLEWRHSDHTRMNHLVIGIGAAPGGTWRAIAKTSAKQPRSAPEMMTLSRRSLMQLPVLEIGDSGATTVATADDDDDPVNPVDQIRPLPDTRVPYSLVAHYYRQYVQHFGLSCRFRNQTRATRLDWDPERNCFLVDTVSKFNNQKLRLRYRAKRVVLAQGTSTTPKRLNIPGETSNPFVIHSLTKLDRVARYTQFRTTAADPVLIVGSGLSAADALIWLSKRCQRRPLRVIHIYRRSIRDRALVFNQLATDPCSYPEYHQVFQHMKHSVKQAQCLQCLQLNQRTSLATASSGSGCSPEPASSSTVMQFEQYQSYQECILSSLNHDGGHRTATIEFLNKNPPQQQCCHRCHKPLRHQTTFRISFALILIGANPQLDFVSDSLVRRLAHNPDSPIDLRHNPIDHDPYTYQCNAVPGLYALGPLVGDNFVRYLQGGALAAANHIWNSHHHHVSDDQQEI